MEVSLTFWREDVRALLDPGAPWVEDRLNGIRLLRQAGSRVVLRIDPLLPRSPVDGKALHDLQFPEAQPLEDLGRLLGFAAEIGVMHVVYSPAKIVLPRPRALSPMMHNLKPVYEHLAAPPNKLVFRGGSWRLPPEVASRHVVRPFLELCRRHGLATQFCKQNLITTP